MPEQPWPREASRAITPSRLSRVERDQSHQAEVISGNGGASNVARPLEFDESGFPVPQAAPSFLKRVARLLT